MTAEETDFKKSDSSISPIRTYKSDYSTLVKDKNIGKVEMIAAEINRGGGQGTSEDLGSKVKFNPLILGLTIIAIIVAGVLGYLVLSSKQQTTRPKQLAQIPPPIIFSEKQETIVLKNSTPGELADEIGKKLQQPFPRNNLVYLPIIKDEEVMELNIGAEKFLEIAGLNAPAIFSQALDNSYMLGVYSKNERYPVLIFKIKLYENAFAGMLEWENRIATDLAKIWPIKSTGVSSKFTDKYLDNHDTRELSDENGNLVLIYSFIDRKTLAITTNEETLRAIFERFTFR